MNAHFGLISSLFIYLVLSLIYCSLLKYVLRQNKVRRDSLQN